jgi:hypothetical protein
MLPPVVALCALGVFLVASVRHLDTVPQVYEDEPWQASTAFKLATQGLFGSDLFAGFYNMDQRYYGFMPLHPLLLAGIFKAVGPGLAQARAETVGLSLLTLCLTYLLGTRLFDAWVGALAVVLLAFGHWFGVTYVLLTGIPLVDFARIARYDPLVPVVGLASLHVYLTARASPRRWRRYLLAGGLAGLAGLAHVYGLFWVLALLALMAWDHAAQSNAARGKGAAGLVLLGALLPWLPYAAYVLVDLPDWRGQTLIYADRFDLLHPAWYLDNALQEYHRYGPGLGPFGASWLARIGFWTLAVGLPTSLVMLAGRALRVDGAAARAVVVPAVLFPALFAALIRLKLANYTLIELPVFAIALGWGAVTLWRRHRARVLLIALGVGLLVDGGLAITHLEQAAQFTTPYPAFIAQVRATIPPGARVLGLHTYWFGLEDVNYRSFLVPLNLADDGLPLDEALSQVAPDVVLLDARMRAYFTSDSTPAEDRQRFNDWLTRHAGRVIGRVDDPTYGLMEVYAVRR